MTAKKPTPVPKESDWSKHDGPRPTSPPPPRKKTAGSDEVKTLRERFQSLADDLLYCARSSNEARIRLRIRECMATLESIRTTTDEQLDEALDALMMMVEQYCQSKEKTASGKPIFDHMFMAAGETACEVLEKHGRIDGTQYA